MLGGLSDEELLRRRLGAPESAAGTEAVNELFRRHQTRVAVWCLRFTGDREQAADLAQEVFVKALRNLGSFRAESKFTTWLYSITRHHCVNYLQSQARGPDRADEAVLADIEEPSSPNPLAEMERENQRDVARRLLAETLDETERAVFILHFSEELPLATITRLLELKNASGAKAYIVSAKRKLKRGLERWRALERRSLVRLRRSAWAGDESAGEKRQ